MKKTMGGGGEKNRRRAKDEDDDDERRGKGSKGSPERLFAGVCMVCRLGANLLSSQITWCEDL
jgi:hypothetical protein